MPAINFDNLTLATPDADLHSALDLILSQIKQLTSDQIKHQNGNISLHKLELIGDHLAKIWRIITVKNQRPRAASKPKADFNKNYNIDWSNIEQELAKLKGFEQRLEQQLTFLIDQGASAAKTNFARQRLMRCQDTISVIENSLKD
ncbi:primosomal replication protein [Neiella sp. HB171785]|uniref:Primosomal replication protein n=1 Tax=Neiella litorisoli TaxID=2771431 RepID=A0A8J6QP72_9GAMM|nr:primosomal replication protein PriC [Neiella litorisoli]MBD1388416.1 primosomal replication protein [Neiella litorisoli]